MLNFRSTLRAITRAPFASAVIVLSLAVGIGANTIVFSWLKSSLLTPLPGATTDVISLKTKDDTGGYVTTSWREYLDVQPMLSSFTAIAAQRPRTFYLGNTERDARVWGNTLAPTSSRCSALSQPSDVRFVRMKSRNPARPRSWLSRTPFGKGNSAAHAMSSAARSS
jgi:hypothetical protein